MAEEKVRVTLKSTYGYFNARKGIKENFGPGQDILVPKGLAYSLGIPYQPVEAAGDENPEESEAPGEPLADDLSILGLSSATRVALQEAGFTTFASIAAATTEELVAVKGVGVQTAERIKAVAEAHLAEEQES